MSRPSSYGWLQIVLLLYVGCFCLTATGDEQTNPICPVMPENSSSSQWSTVYKGKQIHFCCNNCVDAFRKFPHKYASQVPQLVDTHARHSHLPDAESQNDPFSVSTEETRLSFVPFVVIAGTLLFGSWRLFKRLLRNRSENQVMIRPAFVELFVFVLIAIVTQLVWSNRRLEGEVVKGNVLRMVLHSTYFDHGYPPVPPKPDVPKRLSATIYRGNDERSEFLFNGGNYMTALLDIAIQREDGTPITYDDQVHGQELYVSLTVRRAHNTPDRLFAPKLWAKMYLTKECDPLMGWENPIEDRIAFHGVKISAETWQARYPIGVVADASTSQIDPQTVTRDELLRIDRVTEEIATWFLAYRAAGYPIRGGYDLQQAGIEGPAQQSIIGAFAEATSKGIVYVCEANYLENDRQMGARLHYGIQYELYVRDGQIQPESDLWLGSLSRSQKAAKGAIPDDEWLSTEPLPELPAPQNVSDDLLGIDDYPDL